MLTHTCESGKISYEITLENVDIYYFREGELMKNEKETSPRVAKKASAALRSGKTSKNTKSIAGSALTQARSKKGKKG